MASPSVQHITSTQKGHSFSAPKTPELHTPLSSILFLMLNWGVFGVELSGVEVRGVRKWGVLGAEKEWPFCMELMWWTEGDVELRGPKNEILKNNDKP